MSRHAAAVELLGRNGQATEIGIFGEVQAEALRDYVSQHFAFGLSEQDATQSTSGSAAITAIGGVATLSGGDGAAVLESRRRLRYRPGHTVIVGGTAGVSGSGLSSIGLHDGVDGVRFEFDTAAGIVYAVHSYGGAHSRAAIDARYLAALLDSDLFIWRIKFGYYGIAPIVFEILQEDTFTWQTVYVFSLHSKQPVPHIGKPLLPVRMYAGQGAVLKSASFAAGTMGGVESTGTRVFSRSGYIPVADTAAERCLVAFRNKTTFNGGVNPIPARLLMPSFGSAHDGLILVRYRLNPGFSNTPSWTDVNSADSVMEYSTDAILNAADMGDEGPGFIISGGAKMTAGDNADFSRVGLERYPGEVCAITAQRISGTGGYSVLETQTWEELF